MRTSPLWLLPIIFMAAPSQGQDGWGRTRAVHGQQIVWMKLGDSAQLGFGSWQGWLGCLLSG